METPTETNEILKYKKVAIKIVHKSFIEEYQAFMATKIGYVCAYLFLRLLFIQLDMQGPKIDVTDIIFILTVYVHDKILPDPNLTDSQLAASRNRRLFKILSTVVGVAVRLLFAPYVAFTDFFLIPSLYLHDKLYPDVPLPSDSPAHRGRSWTRWIICHTLSCAIFIGTIYVIAHKVPANIANDQVLLSWLGPWMVKGGQIMGFLMAYISASRYMPIR